MISMPREIHRGHSHQKIKLYSTVMYLCLYSQNDDSESVQELGSTFQFDSVTHLPVILSFLNHPAASLLKQATIGNGIAHAGDTLT